MFYRTAAVAVLTLTATSSNVMSWHSEHSAVVIPIWGRRSVSV